MCVRERESAYECVCVRVLGAVSVCLSVRQTLKCLSVHVYEYICDHALRLCVCVRERWHVYMLGTVCTCVHGALDAQSQPARLWWTPRSSPRLEGAGVHPCPKMAYREEEVF